MIPDIQSDEQNMIASIFADEEDLRRYREAISNGATEEQALRVGDNGRGFKGDDTTSMDDPIVALNKDTPGFEYNRRVLVQGPKGQVVARIADTGLRPGRIDLNPATAAAVGHNGGLMPVSWKFLDGEAPSRPNTSLRELGARPVIPDLDIGPMPDMAQPDALSGIDMLTAIGPDEESYQGDDLLGQTPEMPDLGNYQDVRQPEPQSPEEQTGSIKLLAIPAPNIKSLTKTGDNEDGSVQFKGGYRWYPRARGGDGRMEQEKDGHKFTWRTPNSKAEATTPKSTPVPKDTPEDVRAKKAAEKNVLRSQFPIGPKGDEQYERASANVLGGNQGGGAVYGEERARRVVQSVDELLGKVSRKTAGVGSLLSRLPETDARNFKAELDTLKANIAFGELTEMRNASKTGGALGQVSNIELGLLESTLGALDAGQSPDNLKQQLAKVKSSIERWNEAKKVHGDGAADISTTPEATPSPAATPASQEQAYIEWAKQHPDDPRAQIILRHAGQ